ncbi:3-hydroxyacyl-CoA dehydrogenase family protein [Flavitalea flava]
MKIAVLAGMEQKKELESKIFPPGVLWAWVETVDALSRHTDAGLFMDLEFTMDKTRIEKLSELLPVPVVINSVVHTLAEIGQPFFRINAWPGFLGRNTLELAVPDKNRGESIGLLFDQLGWPYRIAPDIPGLISARILAGIINEAYYTLQDEVSTKGEIDTAMRLGTHYPSGPFEWGKKIGLDKIGHLLASINQKDGCFTIADSLEKELSNIKI